MKITTATLIILGAASEALAHYRFNALIVNGQVQPEFKYIRKWQPIYSNSPVENVQSPNLRCNVNAQPDPEVITVSAGSQVGFTVDQAIIHPGPYMAYMARAPTDITRWDGNGDWFKIWEKGATSISSAGIKFDEQSRQWTFPIPSSTPSGQYLLRFEHIGLHSAGNPGGAQFYMSCAQINVVNGGNGNPGPTVRFPGGYDANHPGVRINLYWPIPTSYQIPGPAVWRG